MELALFLHMTLYWLAFATLLAIVLNARSVQLALFLGIVSPIFLEEKMGKRTYSN